MSSDTRSRERLAQKRRTRAALLDAARGLVAEGRTPTVAQTADAAMVSRATGYRYFPSQESLLVEVPLDEAAPTVASLFGEDAPADPEDRAALVHNALYDLARDHEAQFRVFLRGSLTRSLEGGDRMRDPFRGARRAALLDEALRPLEDELPGEEFDQLKAALAVLVGIESLIVLRDVLQLDHDTARSTGEWAVRQLVRHVRRSPGQERA